MSIKQKRNKFNFFVSYYDAYKILNPKQRELFIDYIFRVQFDDDDLNVFPSPDDPMIQLACAGVKHNLEASIRGYRDATRGVGAKKVDTAMQSGMADGTQGDILIDSFTLKYLASNADLFDVLAQKFKEYGKDETHEYNYQAYLDSFRRKMHNRAAGWKKTTVGINHLFETYVKEGWIDLERIDLKEANHG